MTARDIPRLALALALSAAAGATITLAVLGHGLIGQYCRPRSPR